MEWFRNVVLFTVAIGFAQWITPGGVFEKYIKFIISLLTLSVILSPLMGEKAISVTGAALPKEGLWEETWQKKAAHIETVQRLQIREILAQRIKREAQILLKRDFPGITGEDIEVYITQESLEYGSSSPCLIIVRKEKDTQAEKIRKTLQSGLRLPQACIEIRERSL